MKTDNLIELKSWILCTDSAALTLNNLSVDTLAVELSFDRIKDTAGVNYGIKISLNHLFQSDVLRLPDCGVIYLSYRTENIQKLDFVLEEKHTCYDFYLFIPASAEWTEIAIPFEKLETESSTRLKPDMENITGFVFKPHPCLKKNSKGRLYISTLILDGYEIVMLNKKKYSGYTNFLFSKSSNNCNKAMALHKEQKNRPIDSYGAPLYCIYPFHQLRINKHNLTVCCDIDTNENVDVEKGEMLRNVWFGDIFNKIRQGVKDLSYSGCDLGRCQQFNGTRESFKTLEYIEYHYPEIADYIKGQTEEFKELPGYIVNSFDNACNLCCTSCNASFYPPLSIKKGRRYIQQIEDLGENVKELLVAGYGDPFASAIYRDWLFSFSDSHFPRLNRIQIMTNGLLWNKDNWERVSRDIKKRKIDGIISIDGATKKTYEINRVNGRFETLLENMEFISELRKSNDIVSLSACFVVQKNNFREMPEMIELLNKYNFDSVLFSHIENWGTYSPDEFSEINVFDQKHSDFREFKKTYKKIKSKKDNSLKIFFDFEL
ncbi:MAG: radical SAM protein [Spirochaetes bacterium]|nr:radical SAM protein [Spirochaetota bacterium]MBN2769933.1 radical SAM protein [Spirochaetota bacterium]